MDDKTLIERLRAVESSRPDSIGISTNWYRNPDGPDAADALTTLSARVETLEAALREVFLDGHGEGWRGNQTRRDVQHVDAEKSWSLYVSNGALGKTIARKALEGSGNG